MANKNSVSDFRKRFKHVIAPTMPSMTTLAGNIRIQRLNADSQRALEIRVRLGWAAEANAEK